MAFTITVSPDRAFLIVTVTGSLEAEEGLRFVSESRARAAELGVNRVLLDVTGAVNTDTTLNSYDFAYRHAPLKSGPRGLLRVAALALPDDHSHDFVVLASRNAGLDITLFRNRAAAEGFLRGFGAETDGEEPNGARPFYDFAEDE